MAYLNKVMVIGNVGRDPEMRFTPNGRAVTSFPLATNRIYTTADGEQRKETEWFDITTWAKQAESCNQFLTKGQRVYVEGRLRSRSWEGQDGRTRFRLEIIADRVIFLDRRGAGSAELGSEAEIEPDELPF
jgi:single-strand DNA-binding protein